MRPVTLRLLLVCCSLAGSAQAASTQIAPDKPVVNFRLPDFTPEGYRSWLVRGSEARYQKDGVIDISELNLTLFSGLADARIETVILSPSAQVRPGQQVVQGSDTIRVINDRFEATGSLWKYSHGDKNVSIGRNVRVILHTQLKNILQ